MTDGPAWHRVSTTMTMVGPGDDRAVAPSQRAPADVAATDPPAHPGRAPRPPRPPVPAKRDREAPASVVVRGPAPGLVGHPRPSVARPGPASVRVRRPAHRHPGLPDVADRLCVRPGAVAVELGGVGSELLRKIASAVGGPGLPGLEVDVPLCEVVRRVEIEGLGLGRTVTPARPRPLAPGEAHAVPAGVEGGFSLVDRELRLAALDVDADHPGLRDLDQAARGLDLEHRRLAGAGADDEAAGPQAEHDPFVPAFVVGGVVELAPAVEPDHRTLGELELGPARGVGPDAVAGEEGQVDRRFLRRDLGGPLQAHTRFHAADEPVRVVFLSGRRGRNQAGRGDGQARQSECALPHGSSPSGSPRGSRPGKEQGACRLRSDCKACKVRSLGEKTWEEVSWEVSDTVLSSPLPPPA